MSETIAFLGLGAMGFGMATNLLKHHFPMTGYDVHAPSLSRFVIAGGKASGTPREAVKGANYTIFMVATAAQVISALFDDETGAVSALEKGAVVILCSTGPPGYSLAVKERMEGLGREDVRVVDAPVSGGTIRAGAGTLTILASGEERALEEARKVLIAMAGDNLYVIEGGLSMGTKVKMVHQVLAGIHIVMTSEAMGFVARLGLNTRGAFEELRGGRGGSWMFENRVPHMLIEDKTIYSALNIITKDVGIVTAGGRAEKFPLFLSSSTEQVLATGVSTGYGLEDDSKLTKVYLPKDPNLVLEQASSSATKVDAQSKLRLVRQVMAGVHLAAAAEAMSLGAKVGLDTKQLFEIISTAAGSSWMFKDAAPQMLSGAWTSKRTVDDVIAELTESMEEANQLKYPLHLAGTTLQLFQLAAMRGWGKEPEVAICGLWEGADGPFFPRKSS